MSTMIETPAPGVTSSADDGARMTRLSSRFGVAFAGCQLAVMLAMTTLVLPKGGSVGEDPVHWGHDVLNAESWYRAGNYAFAIAGTLLIGFLGAIFVKLRKADPSGVLAAIGLGAGALLALVWPFSAVLHDVAIDAASKGGDVRILAGWDSVAPYSLAFSVLPRVFLVGAIVIALRNSGEAPWLQRTGLVLLPISLIGSATLVTGAAFPLLALSTLGYELWLGAVAWRWMRASR